MTVKKLTTDLYVKGYDVDPDATSLTDVGWIDMSLYKGILASFFRTVGTSTVVFKMIVSTTGDGAGTEATLKTHAQADGAPDAVGDQLFLEASQAEIASQSTADGEAYRWLSVQVSFATGTDEAVVTYIADPLLKQADVTDDIIST